MFLFFDGVIVPPRAVNFTFLGQKKPRYPNKQGLEPVFGMLRPLLEFSGKLRLIYSSSSWTSTYC